MGSVPIVATPVEKQAERPALDNMLKVSLEDGQSLEVQVVEISDDAVVLDGNHPLAGKTLEFDIQLIEFV